MSEDESVDRSEIVNTNANKASLQTKTVGPSSSLYYATTNVPPPPPQVLT